MDPNTPVNEVFTSNEMAQNPHFAKAGTVGALLGSVTGDIDTRRSQYGGGSNLDFSQFADAADSQTSAPPQQPLDFSQFGTAA